MQQYNKPNLENMKKYLEEDSYDGVSVRWGNIKDGLNVFRILPPWDPTGRVALSVYSHRIEYKMPDSNYTKYSWTCVRRTFDKSCNICDGLERAKSAGVDVDDYLPSNLQYYVNALVVYDPAFDYAVKSGRSTDGMNPPGTHVLLRIPKSVYKWIVSNITNPMIGDITDVTSGIDIMVNRSGTGLGTTYTSTLSPDGRKPIDSQILATLELYNLDEIFDQGFKDDQVVPMINSLINSGTHLNNQVNVNTVVPQTQYNQQMPPQVQSPYGVGTPHPQVSYQQPAMPQYGMPSPQMPSLQGVASPYGQQTMQMPPTNVTVPPANQFQMPSQQPVQPAVNPPQQPSAGQVQPAQQPAEVQQPSPQANTPACYGKYDSNNVRCVVCPFEVDCSKISS